MAIFYPPPPQPTQGAKLVAGIPGQSVDNPARIYRVIQDEIARLWDPPPPEPVQKGKLAAGIPGQSVDTPAIRDVDLTPILQSWIAPSPAQVFYKRLIQGTVIITADNPPFGLPASWLWTALGQWQPLPWAFQARGLSPGIPGQSIDPPPLIYPVTRNAIIRLWDPPPPQAPTAGKLSPGIPGQSVDAPPARSLDLRSTLVSFLPGAAIILPRKLSPGIPGQSIDTPPLTSRASWLTLIKAWEPAVIIPQVKIYYPQPPVIITADNPPFGMPPDWFYTVLATGWQPGQPLPKQLQKIIQAGVAPPALTTTPNILDLLDLITVLK